MKRLILGSLVAAVVVFLWGFLYWNVFPFRTAATLPIPDEPALAQALQALPESGTYEVPDLHAGQADEELIGRLGQGPIALVMLRREGVEWPNPATFIGGFLHMLVTALLIGAALRMANLASFGARFGLAFVAGLAAAIFANLGEPIWFYHPWGYHVLQAGYDLTIWALIGLVMAKFVRPD